jgi:aldose 1-epimerase
MKITTLSARPAGTLPDGTNVEAYTLKRGALELSALTYGGIVTELWVPDAAGRRANVVLGFEDLCDYATRNPHFGTITGRLCNRVANGRFMLDGREVRLSRNEGAHSLHGGHRGFGARIWQASVEEGEGGAVLCLALTSPDGEEGYPGTVRVEVRYSLPDEHTWAVDYAATTDAPTVLGLTQHAYFNLAGGGRALDHEIAVAASRFDAIDEAFIPESVCAVDGTPLDLRRPAVIGERMARAHGQLARAGGFDHHFHLDAPDASTPVAAAWLRDPASGRTMTLLTTEPGLQFYSGNFLDGTLPAPGGGFHQRGSGLCLEPQHAPNAANRPDQQPVVLRPGQQWRSRSLYRFGTATTAPSF